MSCPNCTKLELDLVESRAQIARLELAAKDGFVNHMLALTSKLEEAELMLRSVRAATDLEQAHARADKGLAAIQ